MKIVINGDYGGFGLSEETIDRYIELAGLKLYKHKEAEWNSENVRVKNEVAKQKAQRDKERNDELLK